MATVARAIHLTPRIHNSTVPRREAAVPSQISFQKLKSADLDEGKGKVVLQPRLCTLRSYGSDRNGLMKTRRDGYTFFEILSDYIESSRKSQDFEIIFGRLAMVVFAATVGLEMVTGNSLFGKLDRQGIAEAGGVCMGAVACAATFAWFSIARNRVGQIFTVGCNSFIDSIIDQIIDGLFYESKASDWSDEI